jgi:hypothetical protein
MPNMAILTKYIVIVLGRLVIVDFEKTLQQKHQIRGVISKP